jgi:uncharacterized protein DUF6878
MTAGEYAEMAQFDNFSEQQNAEHTQMVAIRNELFAWMERNSIGEIIAPFDGSDDSGQVEEIACYDPGDRDITDLLDLKGAHLPARHSERRYDPDLREEVRIESETTTVSSAIEELVYHYLDAEWDGWEINEGSFGTVTFDLGTRQILVDISVRTTEDHHEEY